MGESVQKGHETARSEKSKISKFIKNMIAKSSTSNKYSKVNVPGGSETVRDSGVSRASGATFTATGRPILSGQISRNSLM